MQIICLSNKKFKTGILIKIMLQFFNEFDCIHNLIVLILFDVPSLTRFSTKKIVEYQIINSEHSRFHYAPLLLLLVAVMIVILQLLRKFVKQIILLDWFKEYDIHKPGTISNSCEETSYFR